MPLLELPGVKYAAVLNVIANVLDDEGMSMPAWNRPGLRVFARYGAPGARNPRLLLCQHPGSQGFQFRFA